jgi:hypothetical protein
MALWRKGDYWLDGGRAELTGTRSQGAESGGIERKLP